MTSLWRNMTAISEFLIPNIMHTKPQSWSLQATQSYTTTATQASQCALYVGSNLSTNFQFVITWKRRNECVIDKWQGWHTINMWCHSGRENRSAEFEIHELCQIPYKLTHICVNRNTCICDKREAKLSDSRLGPSSQIYQNIYQNITNAQNWENCPVYCWYVFQHV